MVKVWTWLAKVWRWIELFAADRLEDAEARLRELEADRLEAGGDPPAEDPPDSSRSGGPAEQS